MGTGMVLGTVFSVVWTCLTILTARRLTYSKTYLSCGVMMVRFTMTIVFYCLFFLRISVCLTMRVILTTRVRGYFTVRLRTIIFLTFYFSLRIIVYFYSTILVSYLIFCSLRNYFCNTIRFTVLLCGLRTCCYLEMVCISHRVFFLVLFLSSACTWQYLCLCSWSVLFETCSSHPEHVLNLQQALLLTLFQYVPVW